MFEDEKRGCTAKDFCRLSILSVFAEEPAMTNEMFGKKQMAYKMMPSKVGYTIAPWLHFTDEYNLPKLMAGMAKNMPQNTFVYVGTQKDNEGVKNPPFIVEKGRVDFFVSPQAKK